MSYEIHPVDSFKWMGKCEPNQFNAIVTDPPYGLKEYGENDLEKMRNGKGGIWRIPPSFDGAKRKPAPRFTVLDEDDIKYLRTFFQTFGKLSLKIVVPGAHLILASTPILCHEVAFALSKSGWEPRGMIIRKVRTLRGGDRPKNAHDEYKNICSMPRGCWEPWILMRKPFKGTLSKNLEVWGAGGLRRFSEETPFLDLIEIGKPSKEERNIADHPSLKPQKLMRLLVRGAIPLDKGRILDPFMGSGATIAAAEAVGIDSVGIEIDKDFYEMAEVAIPKLANIKMDEE